MLDRWSSYTVRIVWEFAWVVSALIILDKWSFYRDGHLNRFGCSLKNKFLTSLLMTTFFSWDSFSNIYTWFCFPFCLQYFFCCVLSPTPSIVFFGVLLNSPPSHPITIFLLFNHIESQAFIKQDLISVQIDSKSASESGPGSNVEDLIKKTSWPLFMDGVQLPQG